MTLRTLAILCFVGGLAAQEPPATPTTPAAPSTASAEQQCPPLLRNVVFIGASATAGFGVVAKAENHSPSIVSVSLAASFGGALMAPCEVHQYGSEWFFMKPLTTGRGQMDEAVKQHPSLVVAIDYLFWYLYGRGDGFELKTESDRLQKLELGLQQLDRLDATTPLVLGDISDMSRAVGKMISAAQLPKLETIKQANERIRAWAEKRGQVVILPLGELVEQLKSDKPVTLGGVTFASSNGRLIQADDLHPTLRGSIALALAIAERVNATFAGDQRLELATDEQSATKRASEVAVAMIAARLKK